MQETLEDEGSDVVSVGAVQSTLEKKFEFITENYLYPNMMASLIDPRSVRKERSDKGEESEDRKEGEESIERKEGEDSKSGNDE